jgi:ASC-1-like (ASCH) protein
MKSHNIKCWPEYFELLATGKKTFEIRENDRDYQVGDILFIQEWDPETKRYTGRQLKRKIKYMIQGQFGLPDNICVMQL